MSMTAEEKNRIFKSIQGVVNSNPVIVIGCGLSMNYGLPGMWDLALAIKNNFISLRFTNVEDQNTIKRLLPDNLGNIADNLALLDVGEAIVVGDATLLPSRIKVEEPQIKPQSNRVDFWQVWGENDCTQDLDAAIGNIIKQSKS